jgi:ribosomal protein L35
MALKMKKMKPKTRKGAVKRIKISNGGNLAIGKMISNRPNDNHRLIRKPRTRKLKAKRSTTLSNTFSKLKAIM